MTLSRVTYRGLSVVVVRFKQFGDGELCGFAHRPLNRARIAADFFRSVFTVARKLCENARRSISKCFEVLQLHVSEENTGESASCAKSLSQRSKKL